MRDSPQRSRWETAWIGLGSNLGDRVAWISAGIRAMGSLRETRLTGISPVYLSAPEGFRRQRKFVNGAVRLATRLSPVRLLKGLKRIERFLGRRTAFRNGPRNIDLDILIYGAVVVSGARLTVPHPRLHERAFALAPCVALDPDIRHPVIGVKLAELLAETRGGARKLAGVQQRRFRRLAGMGGR